VIDVEAHDVAVGVEIDNQTFDDFVLPRPACS
jgi:hypothetical protein